MSTGKEFDEEAAHKYFSSACFNSAWDLIDKPDRTPAEGLDMLLRAAASLYHWTKRTDRTPKNLSIGYWQVSRVLALLGHGGLARRFGQASLDASPNGDAFYTGYAYEALARAAAAAGDMDEAKRFAAEGTKLAELVQDGSNREALLADLRSIVDE